MPNTVVRVRSYRKLDDTKAHSMVGLTDVVQVCTCMCRM